MDPQQKQVPHFAKFSAFPCVEGGFEGISVFTYTYIEVLTALLSNPEGTRLLPGALANMAFEYTIAALEKLQQY